ncbi:MAG: YfaZ family outer membrane protein [Planctomycetota bacterium]|jgi:opacity protein-like surface antigen
MEELRKETIALTVLAVGLICSSVYGQEEIDTSDKWEIRLIPYYWFLEIDAEGTVNGNLSSLSANVDLSHDDIIDYLDFGAMGRIEAWKGKWGLTFDGLFLNLSADRSFKGRSGITNFNLDVDARIGSADFGLAYRLYEQGFANENEQVLAFEPYGGLRYMYLREKADLNVAIAGVGAIGTTLGGSEDWVEPFVGGRVIWDLNKKIAFKVRSDFGGFGIGSASDLQWQILGGVDYKLSENMTFNAGYRYVELDYSRGSGANEFGVDLRAKGPFVGMTIVF